MFRPFWEDAHSTVAYLSWFENFVLAAMVVIGGFTMSKKRMEGNQFFWFCVSFAVILFILIGSITPIAGALIHYKIPALSFLIIDFLSLSRLKFLHEKR